MKIQNLNIFFDIKEITDINSFSVLNYIYFFKYYFGFLPFFVNYDYSFKLNLSYFSFTVKYKFLNKNIYFPLFFLINDVYAFIGKNNLLIYQKLNILKYTVKDMNFFLEKKNSLGFFYLKHYITFEMISNDKEV